ncbi:23S rRNA (cytidine(2498)-2'-O)-methyltransferase RlmM [Arhodomonas sp. AD133]|uniref:23S rRNA (cytidine(2498)-2'-O)-methyltransferase RlmM n=1 Tax=Arhodomonas sp. AD133 TaxID=3415009 RepID=UPI003EBAD555
MSDSTLLLYCRPGFESDLAAELTTRSAEAGLPGYCRAPAESGIVELHASDAASAEALWERLPWHELVFARQWLRALGSELSLPEHDRAGPLATAAAQWVTALRTVWLEYPDTNTGKQLSRFCRRFQRPLERALVRAGVRLDVDDAPRLHVLFEDSSRARLALSRPDNSAPWPLGIPRLRMPRDAPSRSTLKLDEALQSLLDEPARARCLRPGMTAVDLGAAPGGWSWQLARRGLSVTAVDNGPMDTALLAGGLVEHVRADGFTYRPPRPVDWVVCDIVEQPHRIARLMADWLRRGDARAAVFNLKLPMKRRYQAVADALQLVRSRLPEPRGIAVKHLYHDREEVTVCIPPTAGI